MPATAPRPTASDKPITLTITLDSIDLRRVQEMLGQRLSGEIELAEDLRALGRCYDEPIARAGLTLRLVAAFSPAVELVG